MCISEFLVESDDFNPGVACLEEAVPVPRRQDRDVTLPAFAVAPSDDAYNAAPGRPLRAA